MSKIKFRMWNKDKQEMITWQNEDASYCICLNGEIKAIQHGSTPFNVTLPKNLEVMQYTDLKDSQGVEIYESDVVSVVRHCAFQYKDYASIGEIVFGLHEVGFDSDMASCGPAYGFYIKGISKPISVYDTSVGESMIGEYVTFADTNNITVIGNKYEGIKEE